MRLISNNESHDPAINLALEEYCVRNFDLTSDEFILIYLNQPCVVIGKHQNVFAEANLPFLRSHGIPLYRRISGGGTVFHDENNINFSYIRKFSGNEINNYREFTRPIIKTLLDFGVNANLDSRNNIVINGLKVSGNAQFSNMKKMFSHGTLLFDSDLSVLRDSLRVPEQKIISHNVHSVRSSVANIRQLISYDITMEDFLLQLKKNILGLDLPELKLTDEDWQQVYKLADEKYRNDDWNYLRCPDFTLIRERLIGENLFKYSVTITKGNINSINLESEVHKINLDNLLGKRFLYQIIHSELKGIEELSEFNIDEIMNFLY